MSTAPVSCSLATLHQHSIFSPLADHTSQEGEWELVERPNNDEVGFKKQRLAVRDNDVFVAVGRELRMTTLTGESWDVQGDRVGRYKTLASSHLNFDILSLHLNPSRRLLAVVGRTQLVIIVLPKSGWSTGGIQIRCRTIVIDGYQYSPSSVVAITKVAWHPLGESGQSIWVLSEDGKLREYDLQSPTDPAQVYSFLSSAPSSSKFSAVDPLSRYATSFAFGSSSSAGWGEMAAHGLMANGDIYTLCPVLPLRTQTQLSHIHRLKAYASIAGSNEAKEWAEALARQVPPTLAEKPAGPPKSILSRSTIQKVKKEEEETDRQILLHPPHLTPSGGPAPGKHAAVERQGPVVYDPAPPEGEEEDAAVDLVLMDVGGVDGVTVCVVAWSNGRVDVGVQVDPVEARWIGKRSGAAPVLPIAESIQLPAVVGDAPDAPLFVRDFSTNDVVYVQSGTGVARIGLGKWAASLIGETDSVASVDISRLVETTSSPLEGVASMDSVTLGHAVLALSSTNQLAAIDLDDGQVQSSTTIDPAPLLPRRQPKDGSNTAPDPQSLILSKPYDLASTLKLTAPPPSLLEAKTNLAELPTSRRPVHEITTAHARAIMTVLSQLHSYIQTIRIASQATERHLDLQIQEYYRQLDLVRGVKSTMEGWKDREQEVEERVRGIKEEQERLSGRVERVMRGFMDEYKPRVGEVEKRWFDEVERVRIRVRGTGGTGGGGGGGGSGGGKVVGLEQRVKIAVEQVEAIRAARSSGGGGDGGDGGMDELSDDSQGTRLRPLESALTQRSDELKRLMDKIDALSLRVESALEKRER